MQNLCKVGTPIIHGRFPRNQESRHYGINIGVADNPTYGSSN